MEEFLIGNSGAEKILTSLSETKYPLQFINQFQQENGISKKNLPTVGPVLNLLDLHQIPRGDLYLNLLTCLKKDLLNKINSLSKQELEKLLEQTFPYISFEELKDIPMNVMKKLTPEVPAAFLLKLAESEELYEQCPIEVKRQIWLVSPQLYKLKVVPLIYQYIEDVNLIQDMNEQLSVSSSADPVLFAVSHFLPTKKRESNVTLQEIADLFGKIPELYQMFIEHLKRIFAETGNYLLCNLRAEVLMVCHDRSINEIYDTDGSHNVAWCLDASIRDNTLDARRIKEIQTSLNTVQHQSTPLIGDIAMVFANPVAINCIVKNILIQLKEVVKRKQIPKDDESIKFLTYLLVLGLKAHEMIKENKFKIPHVKKHILQTFYPILATQILEDITRESSLASRSTASLSSSTSQQPLSSSTSQQPLQSSTSTLSTSPILDSTTLLEVSEIQDLENCFLKYDVCKKITLSYIIKRVVEKDLQTVDRYLKLIYRLICKDNNINLIENVQSPAITSSSSNITSAPSSTSNDLIESGSNINSSTSGTTTNPPINTLADDNAFENLMNNVDIYQYIGNDFIQSLVSQVLYGKEPKLNTIVIDSFLFKLRFVPFIQKQLVRYLLENFQRMSQRDFITFIQKLYSTILTVSKKQQQQQQNNQTSSKPIDNKQLDDIIHSTRLLMDKAAQRINEKNSSHLFEFFKTNQKSSQFLSPVNQSQQQQQQQHVQQQTTPQHSQTTPQHQQGTPQHQQGTPQHQQGTPQQTPQHGSNIVSPSLSSSEFGNETPNKNSITSAPSSTLSNDEKQQQAPMDTSNDNSGWD